MALAATEIPVEPLLPLGEKTEKTVRRMMKGIANTTWCQFLMIDFVLYFDGKG